MIVCGSRHWDNRELIAAKMFELSLEFANLDCTIVHGRAKGADRICDQEAHLIGLIVEGHKADWGRHGKAAGPIRNEEMAKLGAVRCIAFWDGESVGTKDMMTRARKYGIPVEVVMDPEPRMPKTPQLALDMPDPKQ